MSVQRVFETLEYGPAPESDEPAFRWLDGHDRAFGHFINGSWQPGSKRRRFESHNPASGELLASLAEGGKADIDAAVAAARGALPGWKAARSSFRARRIYALARLLQKHSRLFAVLETLDNGKPIRESRDIDIPLAVRHFYYHAGAAQLMESEFSDRGPIGVCGQIIPWNFPLLMLAWKIAPAIAMGNTVVLKPAEYTPLTALLFADICVEAGLPPGVVNIVTGDGRTGELIVAHPDVDKIAFTGSTAVGRQIRRKTAGSGKSLTLELGGKSPYVVFDDADLDAAVEGLTDAIWFNQGQVCCAGSRLLVQESVAEEFHRKLTARMDKLRVGEPLDKCTDIGAIVHPNQLRRIETMLADGCRERCDVHRADVSIPENGCFYPPTLITGLSPSSMLMQEEIFGPVLAGITFRTPAEAVSLANNTRYGLAASVWTESLNLGLDVAPKLACGVVWVNSTNLFDAAAGFGGRRESGFGREGGWEGLYAYTKPAGPASASGPRPRSRRKPGSSDAELFAIDRTYKLYVGGKQTRPDGGRSQPVFSPQGDRLGHVGLGNRKDIRNAVEAARQAQPGWQVASGHARAQIIYYIAENLAAREDGFQALIEAQTGCGRAGARQETEAAVDRLFTYAAWADKFDGLVHGVPMRSLALAMNEPVGVVAAVCPEEMPLAGFVAMLAPLISMGNACVLVPSESAPLPAAEFCQIIETSDVPGGVVNIVTGIHDELAETLAAHDGVDAIWHFGAPGLAKTIEDASAGNLKRCWIGCASEPSWQCASGGDERAFLRHATEVKNIWVPYGE